MAARKKAATEVKEVPAVIDGHQKEIEAVEKKSAPIVKKANEFTMDTIENCNAAGRFLQDVKDLKKEVLDTFAPIVKAAHEAHKTAKAAEKKHLAPLEEAEAYIKRGIADYERAERQRIREEEEARLKAEAENKSVESVVDDIFAEAPARRPQASNTGAKIEGVTRRTKYVWQVTDVSKVPRDFLMVNQQAITAWVNSLKGEIPPQAREWLKVDEDIVIGSR